MKWIWSGFEAHRLTEDGPEHKKFTSEAQARQFVEKQNDEVLASRVTKPVRPEPRNDNRRHSTPEQLSAEQKHLIQRAAELAKGL